MGAFCDKSGLELWPLAVPADWGIEGVLCAARQVTSVEYENIVSRTGANMLSLVMGCEGF
jgi:hypothetical protein